VTCIICRGRRRFNNADDPKDKRHHKKIAIALFSLYVASCGCGRTILLRKSGSSVFIGCPFIFMRKCSSCLLMNVREFVMKKVASHFLSDSSVFKWFLAKILIKTPKSGFILIPC